jgi:hypothetical protein
VNPIELLRLRKSAREEATYQLALLDSLEGRVEPRFLDDTRRYISGGEAEIGFENLFTNMYDENARISHEQVERLIEISRALRLPFKQFEHLPELEEFPEDASGSTTPALPPTPPSIRDAANGSTT